MRRKLIAGLVGAALAASAATWLVAQPVGQNTFSGNECWNAGVGPGGPTVGFLCSQAFRGGTNNLPMTVAGSFTVGGTSANTTPNNTSTVQYGGSLIFTAQPSAATITLPPNPLQDGITVGFCNPTGSPFATNVVTVIANSNQTLIATPLTLTTLAAGTCQRVQWNLANATWYRIQ